MKSMSRSDQQYQNCGRNRAGRGIDGLGGVLFCLLGCLAALLLVLLDLGAGLLDRNALGPRDRLGGAFPGLLGLRLVAGHLRPDSRDSRIVQRLGIVVAGCRGGGKMHAEHVRHRAERPSGI